MYYHRICRNIYQDTMIIDISETPVQIVMDYITRLTNNFMQEWIIADLCFRFTFLDAFPIKNFLFLEQDPVENLEILFELADCPYIICPIYINHLAANKVGSQLIFLYTGVT